MAHIVGITLPTEAEQAELDRPHSVARWYDRLTSRCWVVQTLNSEGTQIGEAYYCHRKEDAIAEEKRRQAEVDAARAQKEAAEAKADHGPVQPRLMAADEFRDIRVRLGCNQRQMAFLLGYGQAVRITEFETGRREVPATLAMLMRAIEGGYRPDHWPALFERG